MDYFCYDFPSTMLGRSRGVRGPASEQFAITIVVVFRALRSCVPSSIAKKPSSLTGPNRFSWLGSCDTAHCPSQQPKAHNSQRLKLSVVVERQVKCYYILYSYVLHMLSCSEHTMRVKCIADQACDASCTTLHSGPAHHIAEVFYTFFTF